MTSVADIDWLVISLKRTPERLAEFKANNGHLGLPFETLEAVDGLEIDREELTRSGLLVPNLEWVSGALGAALSHRLCWLRSVESGRPVCVLEDDVYLRNDFVQQADKMLAALPDDWDQMQFGYNTDAFLDVELFPGLNVMGRFSQHYFSAEQCQLFARSSDRVMPMPFRIAFGNCCYVVSPKGARRLIDSVFPLAPREVFVEAANAIMVAQSKDYLMNGLYRDMSAFVSIPPLAMPYNDKETSTVSPR